REMGCDIHTVAERFVDGSYEAINDVKFSEGLAPFNWRSYGLFGFLADVRNYSSVPVAHELRGWPESASGGARELYEDWCGDGHSHGWLSIRELMAVDYSQTFFDTRINDMTTLREFLGPDYFSD